MRSMVVILMLFMSRVSLAQLEAQSNLGDFHAPVIYSVTNLPVDIPGGAIVFDMAAGIFKGLAPTTAVLP